MGIEKSQIKAGTLRAHLETIEAQLLTSQREIQQLDGAARAYKGAARSIGQLNVMIQNMLESGELVVPVDEVELAKQLKLWVSRAQQMAVNLADKMSADGLVAQGRTQGIEQAIGVARKSIESEESKALALAHATEQADASPDRAAFPPARPVGARPAQSVAAQRKAEETAHAASEKPQRTRTRTRTRTRKSGGDSDGSNA